MHPVSLWYHLLFTGSYFLNAGNGIYFIFFFFFWMLSEWWDVSSELLKYIFKTKQYNSTKIYLIAILWVVFLVCTELLISEFLKNLPYRLSSRRHNWPPKPQAFWRPAHKRTITQLARKLNQFKSFHISIWAEPSKEHVQLLNCT